jgi:hypothetical protein
VASILALALASSHYGLFNFGIVGIIILAIVALLQISLKLRNRNR